MAGLKDINQTLREQQILSQAAGNVAEAVMTYAENQKAALEKAKEKVREEAKAAEQTGDLTTAERKHYEAQMLDRETARWESGGETIA